MTHSFLDYHEGSMKDCHFYMKGNWILFTFLLYLLTKMSLQFWPNSDQCSHFITPENTRKAKVFWCGLLVFSGGVKWEHSYCRRYFPANNILFKVIKKNFDNIANVVQNLFKVNNKDTRRTFIDIVLVSLVLTLNILNTTFRIFYQLNWV